MEINELSLNAAPTSGLNIELSDGTKATLASLPIQSAVIDALALKAPLASPAFTGTPTGPTAATANNTTQFATTAFVQQELLAGGSTARALVVTVRNQSGGTMTAGTVVYINGATGNLPTIAKAIATSDATSAQTLGLVRTSIANNDTGLVVVRGILGNLNTSGLTEGQQLYLSPTTAGTYTTTKQHAPNHLVYIGIVTRAHPTQGSIEVAVQNGFEMDELHNVSAQSPANGDTLRWNAATSLWENSAAINDFMPFFNAAFNPTCAADTPIITQETGDTPTIVSGVQYHPYICRTGVQITGSNGQGDPYIRFSQGSYSTRDGANADAVMVGELKPGGASQFASWPIHATFVTSSNNSLVEVNFYSVTDSTQIFPLIEVNGRLVGDTAIIRTVTGRGWGFKLQFPYAASRTIKLYCNSDIGLEWITVPSGNSISKPVDTINKLVCVLGDSFVNGAGVGFVGGANESESFAPRLARLIGADSLLLAGIGGTGFVSGGATNAYYTRAAFILTKSPNVLIINGSINDGSSAGAIAAAVTSFLALVTTIPKVIVLGTMVAGYEANHDAVKAATLAAGRTFIDMKGFIYGTGYVGNTVGNGNADFYKYTDGVHPSIEGHRAIALRAFCQLGIGF